MMERQNSSPLSHDFTASVPPTSPQVTATPAASTGGRVRTLYDVLGIMRTATQRDISVAYHSTLLRVLNDGFNESGGADPHDEEVVRHIELAHRVLSNRDKRAQYDEQLFGHHISAFSHATPRADDVMSTSSTVAELKYQVAKQLSQQFGMTVTFMYGLVVVALASMCILWQLIFIGVKLEDEVDWSWDTTLIPLWFWNSMVIIDVIVYFATDARRKIARLQQQAGHICCESQCPQQQRAASPAKLTAIICETPSTFPNTPAPSDATATPMTATTTATATSTTLTTTTATSSSSAVRKPSASAYPWWENAGVFVPVGCYVVASLLVGRLMGHPSDFSFFVPLGFVVCAELMLVASRVHMSMTRDKCEYLHFHTPLKTIPKPACLTLHTVWFASPFARIAIAALCAAKSREPGLSWMSVFSPVFALLVGTVLVAFCKNYAYYKAVDKIDKRRVAISCTIVTLGTVSILATTTMFGLRMDGRIDFDVRVTLAPMIVMLALVTFVSVMMLCRIVSKKVEYRDTNNERQRVYGPRRARYDANGDIETTTTQYIRTLAISCTQTARSLWERWLSPRTRHHVI
jgi:hypothetical protein